MRRYAKWIDQVVVLRTAPAVSVRVVAVEIAEQGSDVWYWATYA